MTIKEILEERAKLKHELDGDVTEERLAEIEKRVSELADLEQELRKEGEVTEKRNKIAKMLAVQNGEQRNLENFTPQVQEKRYGEMKIEELRSLPEYRSAYLKSLQGKELSETEERALTTGAASAGAAVPETTMNMVIDKLRQTSVLFNKVTVTNIPGNVKFVVANAKNDAAWKAEGTDGTAADDTVSEVVLNGYELIKLVEISKAAYAMTIDAFESYIVAELGRRMAIAIENAIISGAGSGSNQPEGIIESISWVTDTNQIEYTLGGDPTYDDFVDMLALLPTEYHSRAEFVVDRDMFFRIKKIKDNDGRPIFDYNPENDASGSILGYDITIDDYMTAGEVLLGDLSYYRINFSMPIEIEADSSVGFASGKVTYRGMAVLDGKVALSEPFVKMTEASE
jgi:HK97 family phage major capsid protein